MARIKRGIITKKKHNKIRKAVKGYIHTRRASIKRAKEAILKAGQHSYIDRKKKKRTVKSLWIIKINAGLRSYGTTYSKFFNLLKQDKIIVNRKVLAQMAEKEPKVFEKFVKEVLK
jgi:large subunit ribosomal protein L20